MAETKDTEKKVSLKQKLAENKALRASLKVTSYVAVAGAGVAGGFFLAKKLAGKK